MHVNFRRHRQGTFITNFHGVAMVFVNGDVLTPLTLGATCSDGTDLGTVIGNEGNRPPPASDTRTFNTSACRTAASAAGHAPQAFDAGFSGVPMLVIGVNGYLLYLIMSACSGPAGENRTVYPSNFDNIRRTGFPSQSFSYRCPQGQVVVGFKAASVPPYGKGGSVFGGLACVSFLCASPIRPAAAAAAAAPLPAALAAGARVIQGAHPCTAPLSAAVAPPVAAWAAAPADSPEPAPFAPGPPSHPSGSARGEGRVGRRRRRRRSSRTSATRWCPSSSACSRTSKHTA